MKKETSYWVKAIQNGLIGGGISLLLSLIGLVLKFETTYIITGLITMGQIFFLAPILFESYMSARQAPANKSTQLISGSLSGLVGGAILAFMILIQQFVNLRAILVNFSPDLVSLMMFGFPLIPGIFVLLAASLLTGLVAAAVYMIPSRVRAALSQAVLMIVLLGLFRDLLVTVISQWGPIEYAFLWLFAQSGLSIPGVLLVFILSFSFVYWRQGGLSIVGTAIVSILTIALIFLGTSQTQLPILGKIALVIIMIGLVFWRLYLPHKQTLLRRTPRQMRLSRWGIYAILAIVVLALPYVLGSYFSEIFDQVGIFILMGLGLNIVVGFAGLLDLGYVAFYAIGAYTIGILTTSEAVGIGHLTFWEATPIALLVAVFSGVVLGLPILRLRGDYLAIVTLGFGEIIRILVLSDWLKPLLGGSEGIQRIVQPTIGAFSFNNQQRLYYLILVGIIIAGFISVRLKSSHLGRSWMALREDEDVAEAMGINKVTTKLLAFAMGALFSGLGGAIFATKIGSVYPQSFSFIVSINILSLIIIGGMGSIPGVFVGGLALVGLPLLLSQFVDFRYFIYGAVLVAMMLIKPEGLVPEETRRLELHQETEAMPYEEPSTVLKTPGESGG